MKREGKPLNTSPRYVTFVRERDQALEIILHKYQGAFDRVLRGVHKRCEEIVIHAMARPHRGLTWDQTAAPAIHRIFEIARSPLEYYWARLRSTTYTMASLGEAEAIGRALGKAQEFQVRRPDLDEIERLPARAGGPIAGRIELALSKLEARVQQAMKSSRIVEDPTAETLSNLNRAFPVRYKIKRAPNVLRRVKRMKERAVDDANQPFMSTGFIDPEAWKEVLEDYLDDAIPEPRGPNDAILFFNVDQEGSVEFTQRYEWELEQEVTQDFVDQVRGGQVDAAEENGISDFQWIAVIDGKTDECCASRDGLSSAEIEAALKSGDIDAGECEATVPPGHFNCRCAVAPISVDMPEETPPDFGAFDDWLNMRAAS